MTQRFPILEWNTYIEIVGGEIGYDYFGEAKIEGRFFFFFSNLQISDDSHTEELFQNTGH